MYNINMRVIKVEQFLPISMEQAWDFFSTPQNLNEITPKTLSFTILTTLPKKMYEGLMIRYKVAPVAGINLNWVTEITHVNEPNYFVDEQRQGPYKMWHHEHHFKTVPGGVLMTDLLHYDIGKSIFGWIAGKLFVHKQVNHIFEYRKQILEQKFGK
jgi:ligand-binding SRPBCC domain-containing protein